MVSGQRSAGRWRNRDCAIDQRIFGPTPPRLFWSSDRPTKQSPFAWGVLMRHGGTALVHRNVLGYVRCVQGRPPSARNRWQRRPKAVHDALTGLLWQADLLPSHYNHANAMRAWRWRGCSDWEAGRLATKVLSVRRGQPWVAAANGSGPMAVFLVRSGHSRARCGAPGRCHRDA